VKSRVRYVPKNLKQSGDANDLGFFNRHFGRSAWSGRRGWSLIGLIGALSAAFWMRRRNDQAGVGQYI
jgi:hypothetical protein